MVKANPPVDLAITISHETRILAKEVLEPTLGVTVEQWIQEFTTPTVSSPAPTPDSGLEVDSLTIVEEAIKPGVEPSTSIAFVAAGHKCDIAMELTEVYAFPSDFVELLEDEDVVAEILRLDIKAGDTDSCPGCPIEAPTHNWYRS